MKFKVGDCVKLRPWSDFEYSRHKQTLPYWVRYLEKETIITDISNFSDGVYYKIAIDDSIHWWGEDCFIDVIIEDFKSFLGGLCNIE